jgi:hypothetical protein
VNLRSFLAELKRRNVYKVAIAYGVVAWFLTQLTTQVFPFFEIPSSAVRFVVSALAVGFPRITTVELQGSSVAALQGIQEPSFMLDMESPP